RSRTAGVVSRVGRELTKVSTNRSGLGTIGVDAVALPPAASLVPPQVCRRRGAVHRGQPRPPAHRQRRGHLHDAAGHRGRSPSDLDRDVLVRWRPRGWLVLRRAGASRTPRGGGAVVVRRARLVWYRGRLLRPAAGGRSRRPRVPPTQSFSAAYARRP